MNKPITSCENCYFFAYVAEKNKIEEFSIQQKSFSTEIASLKAANESLKTELHIIKNSYFYDFKYINFTLAVVLGTTCCFLLLIAENFERTINSLKKELKELRLLKINH